MAYKHKTNPKDFWERMEDLHGKLPRCDGCNKAVDPESVVHNDGKFWCVECAKKLH